MIPLLLQKCFVSRRQQCIWSCRRYADRQENEEEQIEKNGYKSTPVFGFRRITKKLIEVGCTVKGVPGFYQEKDGEWSIHFNPKSAGFLIPIRNLEGLIVGAQIRLDHPYDGRKYIWLSSTNYHMGTSSGSPVHLIGEPGAKNLFITEGPLKEDLSHALSERTFGCVPGASKYANLSPFLQSMIKQGTEFVYEAYDMDKILKPVCRGDYNESVYIVLIIGKTGRTPLLFAKKSRLRGRIFSEDVKKLAGICRELDLQGKMLTWDIDEDGDWAEHVKKVDDYLYDLEQNK